MRDKIITRVCVLVKLSFFFWGGGGGGGGEGWRQHALHS